MIRKALLAIVALIAVAAAIWFSIGGPEDVAVVERPQIPFAPLTDDAIKDPDNPTKVFHVDFARVEHEYPLTRADLAKITPENLKTLSQEEVDQIYGRLTAGPIPDGFHRGDLFFARSDNPGSAGDLNTRLGDVIGGLGGAIADEKVEALEKLGRTIWKGKRFFRDERILRNVIEDLAALRPLIEDESKIQTITVPRQGWLSYILPNTEAWLLFPAKLYCGQSLLDGRRESIIIDYAYTDEVPGYMARPDDLAGRGGLRIRDEVRMVRPGFYLGRAYANRMFLLNFTIYDPETAENGLSAFQEGAPVQEDCWTGEQARAAAK
jgi:hypothetical protein